MFVFHLSTQNIKVYWFVIKRKFVLPIDDKIEGFGGGGGGGGLRSEWVED